jgi:hypothetical protein
MPAALQEAYKFQRGAESVATCRGSTSRGRKQQDRRDELSQHAVARRRPSERAGGLLLRTDDAMTVARWPPAACEPEEPISGQVDGSSNLDWAGVRAISRGRAGRRRGSEKSRRCLPCAGCLLRAMPPTDKKPLSSIAPSHRCPSNRNSSMDLYKVLADSRPTSYGLIPTVEANVTASDQTDLEQLPEQEEEAIFSSDVKGSSLPALSEKGEDALAHCLAAYPLRSDRGTDRICTCRHPWPPGARPSHAQAHGRVARNCRQR